VKVARRQIEQLLNAGAGVIEDAEEHVIAFSVFRQTVDLNKQVTKLLLAEVAHYGTECLLGGNGQNWATHSGTAWPNTAATTSLSPDTMWSYGD
jgi:hypothetical protein